MKSIFQFQTFFLSLCLLFTLYSSEINAQVFEYPEEINESSEEFSQQETDPVFYNQNTEGSFPQPPLSSFQEEGQTPPSFQPPVFLPQYTATCSAQKKSVEILEEVVWSYSISGPYRSVVWNGDTLTGATEYEVTTSYSQSGTYSATIKVTDLNNNQRTIPCGVITVTRPTLSLSCSPSESFISPGSCSTWSLDITSQSDVSSIDWSGHSAVDPQTNKQIKACYPDKGTYLADVRVTTEYDSRTIYCGSVTVMDNPPTKSSPSLPATSGYLHDNTLIEGSCSANFSKASPESIVTWTATLSDTAPSESITWNGEGLDGRHGTIQKVSYSTPGEYTAAFSVRTDDGSLYHFPCIHAVTIDSQNEEMSSGRSFIEWIRILSLVFLGILWVPFLIRKIMSYKK